MDVTADQSPDGVREEASAAEAPPGAAAKTSRRAHLALVLLAAVAVAALPLGGAAFDSLPVWARWAAAVTALAGLCALAGSIVRGADRRSSPLAIAGLSLLGVAIAVTWLARGGLPAGRMTVEYGDGSRLCGEVSWETRDFLRVEIGYTDPEATTHTTADGRYVPDGHAAVLIPAGQVRTLIPTGDCGPQLRPR